MKKNTNNPKDEFLFESYKKAIEEIKSFNPLDIKTDKNDVYFESSESSDSHDSDVDEDANEQLIESKSKFGKTH